MIDLNKGKDVQKAIDAHDVTATRHRMSKDEICPECNMETIWACDFFCRNCARVKIHRRAIEPRDAEELQLAEQTHVGRNVKFLALGCRTCGGTCALGTMQCCIACAGTKGVQHNRCCPVFFEGIANGTLIPNGNCQPKHYDICQWCGLINP